jgi:hypothetical protein
MFNRKIHVLVGLIFKNSNMTGNNQTQKTPSLKFFKNEAGLWIAYRQAFSMSPFLWSSCSPTMNATEINEYTNN